MPIYKVYFSRNIIGIYGSDYYAADTPEEAEKVARQYHHGQVHLWLSDFDAAIKEVTPAKGCKVISQQTIDEIKEREYEEELEELRWLRRDD